MEAEECLHMAILAEITNRPKDMRCYMKQFMEKVDYDLNEWQRDLFSISYKSYVRSLRNSLKILHHNFTLDPEDQHFAAQYQQQVFDELVEVVDEVVRLVDDKLQRHQIDIESRAFYIKIKADYFRYIAEVSDDLIHSEYANRSMSCYQAAMKLLEQVEPISVLNVGLTLNYAVFLYEVMCDVTGACDVAQKALNKAVSCCESSSDESATEYLEELIAILTENVKIWSKM